MIHSELFRYNPKGSVNMIDFFVCSILYQSDELACQNQLKVDVIFSDQ